MIIAIDIETKGLDATQFLQACLIKQTEKGNQMTKIFYDKQELWNHIIELGIKEQKRRKKLSVYSHNAQYDFYGYADLNDNNLRIQSTRPFIASYVNEQGKDIIKFYDTWAIWKMPLRELGRLLQIPKLPTPQGFIEGQEMTRDELIENEEYVQRDTKICLESVLWIKKKLKEEGIRIKNIATIGQIAINYMIGQLAKGRKKDYLFYDQERYRLIYPKKEYVEQLERAKRAGRVEAFQLGNYNNATMYDCNSLWPYSLTQIDIPDMRTERKIKKPLKIYRQEDLLKNIGIHNCLIYNKNDRIGLIPIRTSNTNSYYLKPGQYAIGTWTSIELKEAIKQQYEIRHIEWSILYDKAEENPFKKYIETLYEQRKEEELEINNYFYKMMMNSAIGKLTQNTTIQEMLIDNIEEINTYLTKNYEAIRGMGMNYLYKKETERKIPKPYYNPLIYLLITAHSRIIMYKELKKVPQHLLLYTDTDSIVYIDDGTYKPELTITKEMGAFKLVHKKERCTIYGKKSYSIGQHIHVAGTNTKGTTITEFEQGEVKHTKMTSIKTQTEEKKAGTFEETTRDMTQTMLQTRERDKQLREQRILIDIKETDPTPYVDFIKEIQL